MNNNVYQLIYDTIHKNTNVVLEAFGIKEYNNKQYDSVLENGANDIIDMLDNMRNDSMYNYQYFVSNDKSEFFCDRVSIDTHNVVDWLKHIDVYVGMGYFIDKQDNQFYRETNEQICLITNTASYSYIEGNLIKKDVIYTIKYDSDDDNNKESILPFMMSENNLCLDKISILFLIPVEYLRDYQNVGFVKTIIKHECGHAFDMFITNMSTATLNRDVIHVHTKDIVDLRPRIRTFDIQRLLTFGLSESYRTSIIQKMNADDIMFFIQNNAEFMNKYELSKYLINFENELKNSDKETTGSYYERLCKQSHIYEIRYMLCQTLKDFKKIISNENKKQFAQKHIKDIISVKDESGRYVFDKNFKAYGGYNEQSFDRFIDVLIKRIENIFLKRAHELYANYINNVSESLYRKSRRRKNLNGSYTYLPRLDTQNILPYNYH